MPVCEPLLDATDVAHAVAVASKALCGSTGMSFGDLTTRVSRLVSLCEGLDESQAAFLFQAALTLRMQSSGRIPLTPAVGGRECGLMYYPHSSLSEEKGYAAPLHDRLPGAPLERMWIEQNRGNTSDMEIGRGRNTSEPHNMLLYARVGLSYEPSVDSVCATELNSGWWNYVQTVAGSPQRTSTAMAPVATPLPLAMGAVDTALGIHFGLKYTEVAPSLLWMHWQHAIEQVDTACYDHCSPVPLIHLKHVEPVVFLHFVSPPLGKKPYKSLLVPAAMSLELWLEKIVDIARGQIVPAIPCTALVSKPPAPQGREFSEARLHLFVAHVRETCHAVQQAVRQLDIAVTQRNQAARHYAETMLRWKPWLWLGYERVRECALVAHLARLMPLIGLVWKTAIPDVEAVMNDTQLIHAFIDGKSSFESLKTLFGVRIKYERRSRWAEKLFSRGGDLGYGEIVEDEDLQKVCRQWYDSCYQSSHSCLVDSLKEKLSLAEPLENNWPHIWRELPVVVLEDLSNAGKPGGMSDFSWDCDVDVNKDLQQRANVSLSDTYYCYFKGPSRRWLSYYDPEIDDRAEEVSKAPGKAVLRMKSSRAAGTIQSVVSMIRSIFSIRLENEEDECLEQHVCLRSWESTTECIARLTDGMPVSELRMLLTYGLEQAEASGALEMILCMMPVRESRRNIVPRLVDWFVFAFLLAGPVQAEGQFNCWLPVRKVVLKLARLSVFREMACGEISDASKEDPSVFSIRVVMDEPLHVPEEIPHLKENGAFMMPLTPWSSFMIKCTESRSEGGSSQLHFETSEVHVVYGPIYRMYMWDISGLEKQIVIGGRGGMNTGAETQSSSDMNPNALLEWYNGQTTAQIDDAQERHRKEDAVSVLERFDRMARDLHLMFSLTEDRRGIMIAAKRKPKIPVVDDIKSIKISVLGNGGGVERFDKDTPLEAGAECRTLSQVIYVIQKFAKLKRENENRKHKFRRPPTENTDRVRRVVQRMAALSVFDAIFTHKMPFVFGAPSQSASASGSSSESDRRHNEFFAIDMMLRLPEEVGRAVIIPGHNFFGHGNIVWPEGVATEEPGMHPAMFAILADRAQAAVVSGFVPDGLQCDPADKQNLVKMKIVEISAVMEDLVTGGVPSGAFVRGTVDWNLLYRLSGGS